MTGNETLPKVHGDVLATLIYYRVAFPVATADEVIAHIYRTHPNLPSALSRQDISRAEGILDLTTKVISTTAMQGFEAH